MNLAIIPARGGSKRIPRKNIRSFHGRPIIAYPIAAACSSGCFDEVMVSTDDAEIADVARGLGAAVPFLRSTDTAGDFAGTEEVILEVVNCYAQLGRTFDAVCCIYATAVLVTAEHLRQGWQRLRGNPALTAVVPVLRFGYPAQRALALRDGRLPMMWPEYYDSRSQDLEPAYHDAGQWYWLRLERFRVSKEMLGPNCGPLVLGQMEAQDIDHEDDWRLAEMKFSLRLGMAVATAQPQ